MRHWVLAGLIAATLGIESCAGTFVGVYATMPPPPIRVETYGPAPGPGFLWIRGYWVWRTGAYVWIPGRWERIPPGRRRWEDGRWARRGDRYYWRDGRWR
jgi:hypothetical protein